LDAPKLGDLLLMDQAKFSATFKGSPVKRTKRRGLLRNAAVALGNIGSVADVPVLGQCLCDHEILVREHAAWALGQVGGDEAVEILQAALEDETESDVLNEIRLAIETIQTKKG
jgi:epoxyqueuosine reductase